MEANKAYAKTEWINCAKFIAILAVIADHTNGVLYTDTRIALASYFSVTVFIFLSGITSFYSNHRHENNPVVKDTLRRIKGILVPYAVATLLYQIVAVKFWDMKTYMLYLFNFSICGVFYFVVFYVQLLIISPLLYRLIVFCKGGGISQNRVFV